MSPSKDRSKQIEALCAQVDLPGVPIAREGPEDAKCRVIVLESPESSPATPGAAAAERTEHAAERTEHAPDHLATDHFISGPRDAALQTLIPPLIKRVQTRVQVTVGDGTLELPHDDPAELAAFVETAYSIYGWKGVGIINRELTQMVMRVDPRTSNAPPPDRSPDPFVPQELGEVILVVARESGESLPSSLWRGPEELAQRIGVADAVQVHEWANNYADAFMDLRLKVMNAMRDFERAAICLSAQRFEASRVTTLREATKYFRWSNQDAADKGLNQLKSPPPLKDDLAELNLLKKRLKALSPLAQAVLNATDRLQRARQAAERVYPTGTLRDDIAPTATSEDVDKAAAALEQAKIELSSLAAIFAADQPVLFRFNADAIVEAAKPGNLKLSGMIWKRLRATREAAIGMSAEVREHRPAAAIPDDVVKRYLYPEVPVAANFEKSVWAYPKLVEMTLARMAPDDAALVRAAIGHVNQARVLEQQAALFGGIAESIGLMGLLLTLHFACPPAGFALDLALSATDVWQAGSEYISESNEALCDLDPAIALAEHEPSDAGFVFAVAGAAMTFI